MAVFLGVLPFEVDRKPEAQAAGDTHQQINGMETGGGGLKRQHKTAHNPQQLLGQAGAGGQSPRLSQLGGVEAQDEIGDVGNDDFFEIFLCHRSNTFFLIFSPVSRTVSLNCASFCSTEGREAFFTFC